MAQTNNILAERTSIESYSQNMGTYADITDNSAVVLPLFCKLSLSAKWVNRLMKLADTHCMNCA